MVQKGKKTRRYRPRSIKKTLGGNSKGEHFSNTVDAAIAEGNVLLHEYNWEANPYNDKSVGDIETFMQKLENMKTFGKQDKCRMDKWMKKTEKDQECEKYKYAGYFDLYKITFLVANHENYKREKDKLMEFANYFNKKAKEHKEQIKKVEDQEHAIDNEKYTNKALEEKYSSFINNLITTGGKKTRRRIKNKQKSRRVKKH